MLFPNLSILGGFNGFHEHRRKSSSGSESGSELNVPFEKVRVKAEPKSPKEYDRDSSSVVDRNNNENVSSERKKRSFSDINDNEPNNDEQLPKTPRARSPISKPTDVSSSSIDLLQRIFPHQSRAVLELIMRSSGNDVVKAIESLIPDEAGRNFSPTFPVSARNLATSYAGHNSKDDGRKSAFSPIAKSGNCVKTRNINNPQLSPFQPVHQTYACPDVSPTYLEHFKYPVLQGTTYNYNSHVSSPLLSLSNAKPVQVEGEVRPSLHCANCGFKINLSDRFCSECGKCLRAQKL